MGCRVLVAVVLAGVLVGVSPPPAPVSAQGPSLTCDVPFPAGGRALAASNHDCWMSESGGQGAAAWPPAASFAEGSVVTVYSLRWSGDWGAPSLLGHGLRENPMSPGGGGMVRSRQVKGAGSAPTEGARRATGVGADAAAMGSGALAPGQRWSASRKRDVVLRLLRSEPLDAVSREVGVEVYRLERWKVRALAGLERGLKEQAGEPLAAELDAAKRHIGELSMDNELLRSRARAAERRLPLATRRSRR